MKSSLMVPRRLARIRQKGLTLIEAAMVLGIAAIVIAGVLVLYNTANTSSRTSDTLNQLNLIQQAVRQIYGGQATFTGLDTTSLISGRSVPARMIVDGTHMANAFNGPVTVTATDVNATQDGFTVDFGGIPVDACVALATKDYGRSLNSLSAGPTSPGTTLVSSTSNSLPTATDAGTACSSPSSNHMVWVFQN